MDVATMRASLPTTRGGRCFGATAQRGAVRPAAVPLQAPGAASRVVAPRRLRVVAAGKASESGHSVGAPTPSPELPPSPWAVPPPLPPLSSDAPPPPPGTSLYPPSMYGSAPYPGAYPYYPPPPPPPKAAAGSGFPPWVWVALGVALAGLGGKLLEGAKSKQQDIQQAMMQQMLKSMMGGAAPPGGMPFPGGAAGFPRPPTPPPGAAGKGATVDTTATAVKEAPKPASPPPPPQAMPSTPRAAEAPKPSSSGSYFRDAEVMDAEATPSASSSSAGSSGSASGAQPSGGPAGMSVEMLENMMRDPNMQKLIYPYLPEGMRNPQTFEWMLKNPATRAQLETMLQNNSAFAGMAGGPGGAGFPMADALKNFDLNSPEVKEQFDAMGMKPEDVVGKIMSNPELTAAFQNPKIQAAIMDCSSNPMNITKYQDDKEIMDVFEKISTLFPGMGGPPGM